MTSEVDTAPCSPPLREKKSPYPTVKKLLLPSTFWLLRVTIFLQTVPFFIFTFKVGFIPRLFESSCMGGRPPIELFFWLKTNRSKNPAVLNHFLISRGLSLLRASNFIAGKVTLVLARRLERFISMPLRNWENKSAKNNDSGTGLFCPVCEVFMLLVVLFVWKNHRIRSGVFFSISFYR